MKGLYLKILVIDDDLIFLDRMQKILSLNKHTVITSSSGKEALLILEQEDFDLILTDLRMPGLSGIELIKKINERRDQLIIMITGYGTIETAVEAMKIGAFDYILKPFDIKTLKSKVKEVETELNLRKKLNFSKIVEKSQLVEFDDVKDLNDYSEPYFIISDEDPKKLIDQFHLPNASSIMLAFHESENCIPPSKLNSLKIQIEKFINKNDKGTIIIKGIEKIIKIHRWEAIKRFIIYLQSEVISSNFILVIILESEPKALNHSKQQILKDALITLTNPNLNKLLTLISHPIRKKIITLLSSEKKLNFNRILKKLDIKNSSLLAFHMNKLEKERIFLKENGIYMLSPRGHYLAEMITVLEHLGFIDPQSQIKIYKFNNKNTTFLRKDEE